MLWQIREDGGVQNQISKVQFLTSVFFFSLPGMAAVNAVFETLKSGDHVVASNQVGEKKTPPLFGNFQKIGEFYRNKE